MGGKTDGLADAYHYRPLPPRLQPVAVIPLYSLPFIHYFIKNKKTG
jgi:hypothetical protein